MAAHVSALQPLSLSSHPLNLQLKLLRVNSLKFPNPSFSSSRSLHGISLFFSTKILKFFEFNVFLILTVLVFEKCKFCCGLFLFFLKIVAGGCKWSLITCSSSNGSRPGPIDDGVKSIEELVEEKRRAELAARIASGEFTVKQSRLVMPYLPTNFYQFFFIFCNWGF